MNTIYIIRHAQSTTNVEHRIRCHELTGDLTDLGREQAHKAGLWLADRGVTRITASPFHRAQQTAQIVAEHLGLPIMTDDLLREMDCGDLEGRNDKEAWAIWQTWYNRWLAQEWDATYPGGESYRQAFERFNRALQEVPPDENVLLVTHGGMMRTIVPPLCVNAAALQQVSDPDNTGFILLEPYDAGRYTCVSWNLTEHL